ncbi:hydroxymethylglutaryl-CoA lyase [Candidimonas humi]|uniref:Hydroxymethylglutaryl-CoA lyase n=1 Tax=Candidimonas humi TaxID=683355 RepID=A0ABV8NYU8_9BURK|nr:hydroxymethylglutaryl-CoA lyase [Candidimonas humi]MBV6304503.1 hydroxymethylglutaryl-CoA lyase [Candidimonas humi]
MYFPEHIDVVEVGPRDGLQSLKKPIPTEDKIRMVDRLSDAGLSTIEVTGFAHPRVIPNLQDAEEVCERIKRAPGTIYRGLAPNARGAQRAVAARIDEVVGLVIASASYLKKNQNMTPEQAQAQAIEAFRIADAAGLRYVLAIGMSFWCPYEGIIPESRVSGMVKQFRDAGIRRMYLAGSVGMEDPRHVASLFSRLRTEFADVEFGFHVHNLSGMATANMLAAIDGGAHWLEGAICGIGGGIAMPETLGAVGNFPTEDMVRMLELMGIDTGLNADAVLAAARDIAGLLEIEPRSHGLHGSTREAVMQWGRDHPHEHPA